MILNCLTKYSQLKISIRLCFMSKVQIVFQNKKKKLNIKKLTVLNFKIIQANSYTRHRLFYPEKKLNFWHSKEL